MPPTHPKALSPPVLLPLILLSALGAVIGMQLLTSLGVTPNTSLIGALLAMVIGRVRIAGLGVFRSVHAQNLAQSAMSAATFGAANSLLLPMGVPWIFGRPDLVLPMFAGVSLAMLLDATLLYRMFDTPVFPASGAWPPGAAAAEAIRAGDEGGRQGALLGGSIAVGALGAWLTVPMSAFGTAFIGNVWALTMFGIGLLASGYSQRVLGLSLLANNIPHGLMIGAGLVALVQVFASVRAGKGPLENKGSKSCFLTGPYGGPTVTPCYHNSSTAPNGAGAGMGAGVGGDPNCEAPPRAQHSVARTFGLGAGGFIAIAMVIALGGGVATELSALGLAAFVLYAAFAAFLHEIIVGLAAMHSGWFPAFAVALITLLIGMLLGFPPVPLALLVGFTASTGPAFADMGYDLKAGFVLRGEGRDPAFERDGRREQFIAAITAFLTAALVVFFSWRGYFVRDLLPPVDRVFVATINAGVAPGVAAMLMLWAIPGALLQWGGGSRRQLGVLLSTGLLIANVSAGWAVLAGIALRVAAPRLRRAPDQRTLEIMAAGFIAGDALFAFGDSVVRRLVHPSVRGAR